MSDTDDLVAAAQRQLDEHKEWLIFEIAKWISSSPLVDISTTTSLITLVPEIKLRVARCTSRKTISVVWDYPDGLYAFLTSDLAPKHLRDSLAGGHKVDPSKPASSVRRATPADEEGG